VFTVEQEVTWRPGRRAGRAATPWIQAIPGLRMLGSVWAYPTHCLSGFQVARCTCPAAPAQSRAVPLLIDQASGTRLSRAAASISLCGRLWL